MRDFEIKVWAGVIGFLAILAMGMEAHQRNAFAQCQAKHSYITCESAMY